MALYSTRLPTRKGLALTSMLSFVGVLNGIPLHRCRTRVHSITYLRPTWATFTINTSANNSVGALADSNFRTVNTQFSRLRCCWS
ncbi:uncharacterized protein C8Q71DRAFT_739046 [Rhodofomes roseus]|uniref:Secreted protein n=1 Tax=Rhodofomes roseus TaxID=34475 RepID=A0ABQ8KUY5_9APHY|nr:uncharacterized protein C8Q71DRAFT_739046 [Rhodofomes roseus]KAH9841843.1 hypothetical protein C8Q71DRAFT_739046 [Rhodofomes roseus]